MPDTDANPDDAIRTGHGQMLLLKLLEGKARLPIINPGKKLELQWLDAEKWKGFSSPILRVATAFHPVHVRRAREDELLAAFAPGGSEENDTAKPQAGLECVEEDNLRKQSECNKQTEGEGFKFVKLIDFEYDKEYARCVAWPR